MTIIWRIRAGVKPVATGRLSPLESFEGEHGPYRADIEGDERTAQRPAAPDLHYQPGFAGKGPAWAHSDGVTQM
jgi:hypothetical protein